MRKEWTRKAAEAGRVWGSVPKRVGGPIQRRFRSRPGIKGLAFGFYGDWSREVDDFIAEVAKKGGSTPERFGCSMGWSRPTGSLYPGRGSALAVWRCGGRPWPSKWPST